MEDKFFVFFVQI